MSVLKRRPGGSSRITGASWAFAVWLLSGLVSGVAPGAALAQPPVHGALDASALVSPEGRYGAALSLDLLWGRPLLRAGLTAGVGALSGADGQSSQVFTPLGFALTLARADDERSSPFATLRAGAAPGAEKGGLTVFGFGACAAGYRFALGEGASVRLGVHAQYLLSEHAGVSFGPLLGLGF